MKKFPIIFALAEVILVGSGIADAGPILFGCGGLLHLSDWGDTVTGPGVAVSRLRIGPGAVAVGETEFPGWGKLSRSFYKSNSNYSNSLLINLSDSYYLDGYPDKFPGIYRLSDDPPKAQVWSFPEDSSTIGSTHIKTSLITSTLNASNYTKVWENMSTLEDREYLDIFPKDNEVKLVPALRTILLAGIAAGLVGWLGIRRILPSTNISDI